MLHLNINNIIINFSLKTKEEILQIISDKLLENNSITTNFVPFLKQRENQISTYLSNNIAIPHGVKEASKYINKTDIIVIVSKEGVTWNNDEEKAKIIFGICSKNQEHLTVLSSLTKIIGNEEKINKLINSNNPQEFYDNFYTQSDFVHQNSITINKSFIEIKDLLSYNANKFKQIYNLSEFQFNKLKVNTPLHLYHGLFINYINNDDNSLIYTKLNKELTFKNYIVKALLTISINEEKENFIKNLLNSKNIEKLLSLNDLNEIKTFLDNLSNIETLDKQNIDITNNNLATIKLVVKIGNELGIHARPAAEIVKIIKAFKDSIFTMEYNGDVISAKSSVKILSLGITKNSIVTFTIIDIKAQEIANLLKTSLLSGLGEDIKNASTIIDEIKDIASTKKEHLSDTIINSNINNNKFRFNITNNFSESKFINLTKSCESRVTIRNLTTKSQEFTSKSSLRIKNLKLKEGDLIELKFYGNFDNDLISKIQKII